MESNLIDLKTFRNVLQLGRDYVYTAAREGRLRAWKPNGKWMVPLSEIKDFPAREIEDRKVSQ